MPWSSCEKPPRRNNVEYFSQVAQIIALIVVLPSLCLVYEQVRDSRRIAARSEAMSMQARLFDLRSSIYSDEDIARLFARGMENVLETDVERLRFEFIVREYGWVSYQVWKRVKPTQKGGAHFIGSADDNLLRSLCTPGGGRVWHNIKDEFPAPFVADLTRQSIRYAAARAVTCPG